MGISLDDLPYSKWRRYRFRTDAEDYRPVIFNKSYPWWCSGYSGDDAIVIAYLPGNEPLVKYWPEAKCVDVSDEDDITFTDRFPKPDYYIPSKATNN